MAGNVLKKGIVFLLLILSLAFLGRAMAQSDTVLAKVGNAVVTRLEFDEAVKKFFQIRRERERPIQPEEKKMILDNLIKTTLISLEAEKERLSESPEVKIRLKMYRDELLVREYVNVKVQPSVTVSKEEVDQKLKQNPNMIPKESLNLKEIVVKTEKEAQDVYNDLKKGGDFSSIASVKSIAQTKIWGGQIRQPVARGHLPKELEEVAFSLKKGEFSKPVKTDQGYVLLYLAERKVRTPEEMKYLEDRVREKIKGIENMTKIDKIMDGKVAEMKKKVKVEAYYDRLP